MHDFDLVAVDFDLGAIYPIDVLRSATLPLPLPEPLPLEPLPPEPLPPEPLPLEPLPPEPLPLEPSFANAVPTRRLLPSTSGEAASARTKVEPISRFAI